MKLVQLIVAASFAVSAGSSFAQSTPPRVNDDVRVQLTREKLAYQYSDSGDQTQAATADAKRTELPPYRVTGLNFGRYSLSVVRTSFWESRSRSTSAHSMAGE
jgi:hypothetical protein